MRRSNGKLSLALVLVLLLSGFRSQPQPAQASAADRLTQPLPALVWGALTLNGAPAPDTTVVEARINGVAYASAAVLSANGQPGLYRLYVPGDDPGTPGVIEGGQAGQTITLHVAGYLISQTALWNAGAIIPLNLTGALFTPTPAPSATARPTLTPLPTLMPLPTPTGLPSATPAPVAPPIDGQAVGAGGVFACAEWNLTLPTDGSVPSGSTLQCGAFNPAVAPPAPAAYQLLGHTLNVHLYNPGGSWMTTFTTPLGICLTYSPSDLAAAGNDPGNLVIQTAPIGGAWSPLATTANLTLRQVCASVNHLTLFDLSARAGAAVGQPLTYRVRWGDTLFSIARRFNLTVAALMAANNLSATTIYPGQTLVIHSSALGSGGPGAGEFVAAGRYVVRPGDTLFSIARRAGISVGALQAANGLGSSFIYAGQVLVIPAPTSTGLAATGAGTYVVRPGDTLFSIARAQGVSVSALMAANNLSSALIYSGQTLVIPSP